MHLHTRESGRSVIGFVGLAFTLFSLVFGWNFVGDDLKTAWRVRNWVEVPAMLVEVSGHPRGMGARYHYQFGGRRYDGAQVGFYDTWSGPGFNELHVANYRSLRAKLEASGPVRTVRASARDGHALRATGAGAAITVRVDPANPAQAVIDPRIQWARLRMPALILAALAAGGLAFAAIGFLGAGRASTGTGDEAMRMKHAIRGSSREFPAAAWLIGIFWCALVSVLAFDFHPTRGNGFIAALALGAFAVVGLYILWRALLASLRWQRYRGIVLALDPHPAETGGVVAGSLVVPVPYDAGNRFEVALGCTEYGQHGGELTKSNSYQRMLFDEKAIAHAAPAPGGTRLTFRIALPDEAPPSNGYGEPIAWGNSTAKRVFVCWALTFSADVGGVDLEERFEIPVRKAAPGGAPRATARMVQTDPPAAAPIAAPASAATAFAGAAMPAAAAAPETMARARGTPAYLYERAGTRIRITQPAWNKPIEVSSPSSIVFGLGPCVGFMALGVVIFRHGQLIPGTVFFLAGAVVLLAAFGYVAHSLTVDVDDIGVTIEHRILGLLVKRVALARGDISGVLATADSGASSSSSMLTRDVKLRMLSGTVWTIAFLIPRARDAVALRNLVAARLGIGASGSGLVAPATVRAPEAPQAAGVNWVRPAGIALILAVIAYQAWPTLKGLLGFRDPVPAAAQRAAVPAPVRQEPPLAVEDWKGRFNRAFQAAIEGRPQDALRHYGDALAVIERTRGANDPLAAAMLERIGDLHTTRRDYAKAEPALRHALAILDANSHTAVRTEAGKLILGFDREKVLRELGWALWELRRYPESLAIYQRAYDTVAELELDEASRNRRLAYDSAGIMVTACTQEQWDRADRAMAELKERIQSVSDTDRRWLDYWIRTGAPRLAARKC